MMHPATERRRAVVALGGNALLRRGEPLEAAYQALMGDAYKETEPYPLDVLDAETEGHSSATGPTLEYDGGRRARVA